MKTQSLLGITLACIITGCSSTNPFSNNDPSLKLGQKMEVVVEPDKPKAASDKPIDKSTLNTAQEIPVWYLKPPIQEGYIFGTGTSRSRELSMAKEKAMTIAQGKIAESVGGKVSKQTKIFRTEAGSNVIESSNSLTKKTVTGVDFTGSEMRDVVVRLEPNGYYRVYVLMTMPLGENNQVLKQQMDATLTREMLSGERKESQELEKMEKQGSENPTPNRMLGDPQGKQSQSSVEVIPLSDAGIRKVDRTDSAAVAALPHNSIKNEQVKERINNLIKNDPDTVIITGTVQ